MTSGQRGPSLSQQSFRRLPQASLQLSCPPLLHYHHIEYLKDTLVARKNQCKYHFNGTLLPNSIGCMAVRTVSSWERVIMTVWKKERERDKPGCSAGNLSASHTKRHSHEQKGGKKCGIDIKKPPLLQGGSCLPARQSLPSLICYSPIYFVLHCTFQARTSTGLN